MTQDELQKIIENHKLWMDDNGGARANLAGAYLGRANLAGAYLAGAYLGRAYLAGAYLAGAYLAGANLAGANLAGANLNSTTGNSVNIKSIYVDTYPITYTDIVMQIGCQRHEIPAWWNFTDAEISKMDGKRALDWWQKFKPLIRQIIEMSPALPTKTEQQP